MPPRSNLEEVSAESSHTAVAAAELRNPEGSLVETLSLFTVPTQAQVSRHSPEEQ